MKNIFLIAGLFLTGTYGFSQVTYEDNDPNANPVPLGYLGWNDNTNTNLNILQNNTLRERFTSVNFAGHNGANAVNNASRIHLGLNGNFQNPFSMIHMGANINSFLYRPWMNVGITMGVPGDILHLGILQRAMPGSHVNQIDAVLAWGCNDDYFVPGSGPDNFRFLFIAPTGVDGDAGNVQGRETMRITPMGNVGIGDFSHMPNGLNQQPTQRLDVNGTARLRQMPTNQEFDVVITGKYAASPGVNGDYVLNYSTIADVTDALNIECDWNVVNAGADVAMGYTGACVEGSMLVGTTTPTTAKAYMTRPDAGVTLMSEANTGSGGSQFAGRFNAGNSGLNNTGVNATAIQAGRNNFGVDAFARTAGIDNFGVRGNAQDGRINYGVQGIADIASNINFGVHGSVTATTVSNNNVGVYGFASGSVTHHNFGGYFLACDVKPIGVYAEACNGGGPAGYFAGTIVTLGTPISLSDETIKTDISPIEGALGIIAQLEPVHYNFNTDGYAHLNLDPGLNYGFRAQQVQEVLPNLVKEVVHPAKLDSLGNEISPEENLLGIQYQQMISILTAGMKEQQAIIESQNEVLAQMMEQLANMQQQINQCCNAGDGNKSMLGGVIQPQDLNNEKSIDGGNELYQNIPNPFRESTTISYQLETGGRVQLAIYDGNGKVVTTLVDANQENGRYSEVWNANGMPAGVYHYALYVDGELLVKRAIKLQE